MMVTDDEVDQEAAVLLGRLDEVQLVCDIRSCDRSPVEYRWTIRPCGCTCLICAVCAAWLVRLVLEYADCVTGGTCKECGTTFEWVPYASLFVVVPIGGGGGG